MKARNYGIFKMVLENVTTYFYFPISDRKEAEKEGFEMIDQKRTQREAAKKVTDLYKGI